MANYTDPGMAFWQGRDDAQRNQFEAAQNQRRNALADIAQQRQDTQWEQGQQDRQAQQATAQQRALLEQGRAELDALKYAPPEARRAYWEGKIRARPELQQFGITDPEQGISALSDMLDRQLGNAPQSAQAAQIRQPASVQEYEYAQNNPGYADWVKRNQPQQSASSHGRAPIGFRFTPDGQLEPIPGGPQDPNTKRDNLLNKSGAAAAANLPTIEQNAKNSLATLEALERHPGIAGIFGVRGAIPNIRGSEAAGAAALRDQVIGGAFLEAFNTLKGGGQITEVEGKKATAAITRLENPAIGLREAITAIQDLKQVIKAGVVKAKKQAALGLPQDAPAGGVVDFNSL